MLILDLTIQPVVKSRIVVSALSIVTYTTKLSLQRLHIIPNCIRLAKFKRAIIRYLKIKDTMESLVLPPQTPSPLTTLPQIPHFSPEQQNSLSTHYQIPIQVELISALM